MKDIVCNFVDPKTTDKDLFVLSPNSGTILLVQKMANQTPQTQDQDMKQVVMAFWWRNAPPKPQNVVQSVVFLLNITLVSLIYRYNRSCSRITNYQNFALWTVYKISPIELYRLTRYVCAFCVAAGREHSLQMTRLKNVRVSIRIRFREVIAILDFCMVW